jgi:TatD DNase family protein
LNNNNAGSVVAVCLSQEKGTPKQAVDKALLQKDFGFLGDAHAGNWHRQVSLLDYAEVIKFREKNPAVCPGAFGENLLISGLDLKTVPVGAQLRVGEAILEITQIGKQCHSHCQIHQMVGDCLMPKEGLFARVLLGAMVQKGDAVTRL